MLRWIGTLGLSAAAGFAASMLAFAPDSAAQGGGDVFASSTCGWPGHPVDMQRIYAQVGRYPNGRLLFLTGAEKSRLLADLRNQPQTPGGPIWELAPCFGCTQDREACILYSVRNWRQAPPDIYGVIDRAARPPAQNPPTGGGDVYSSDCRNNPQSYTCLYGRRGDLPRPGRPNPTMPDFKGPDPEPCWTSWVGGYVEVVSGMYEAPGRALRRYTPPAKDALEISQSEPSIDPRWAKFAPGVRTAQACNDNGCFPSAIAQDRRWRDGKAWIAKTTRNPFILTGPVSPRNINELLRSEYGTDQFTSIPNFDSNWIRQLENQARDTFIRTGRFPRGLLGWDWKHENAGHIVNWRLKPRYRDIALISGGIESNYCPDVREIAKNSTIEFWDPSVGERARLPFDSMKNVQMLTTFGQGSGRFIIPERRRP